jgi:hypothetical protein
MVARLFCRPTLMACGTTICCRCPSANSNVEVKSSSLLKFFYEFRGLFSLLSAPSGNLVEALRGNPQAFNVASSAFDLPELFSNTNDRPLEIQLDIPPGPADIPGYVAVNVPSPVTRDVLTVPRGTTGWWRHARRFGKRRANKSVRRVSQARANRAKVIAASVPTRKDASISSPYRDRLRERFEHHPPLPRARLFALLTPSAAGAWEAKIYVYKVRGQRVGDRSTVIRRK